MLVEEKTEYQVKQFLPSVAFDIETSHLFYFVKQMTGFYMKRNAGLKRVKQKLTFN